MAALLASKMPVSEASVVLEHLTGVKLPRATLDREARRQGERARRQLCSALEVLLGLELFGGRAQPTEECGRRSVTGLSPRCNLYNARYSGLLTAWPESPHQPTR